MNWHANMFVYIEVSGKITTSIIFDLTKQRRKNDV